MPGPQHKPTTCHPDSTLADTAQADGHRAAATAGHQAAQAAATAGHRAAQAAVAAGHRAAQAAAAAGHQAARADGRRAARMVAQLHGRQQATQAGIKHHSPKWMAATVGRS